MKDTWRLAVHDWLLCNDNDHIADPGEGALGARPLPLKLEKYMIFWRKIVIFHTKYPKIFRVSPLAWNPWSAPVVCVFVSYFTFLFVSCV
jgi:hypothetical protein